MVTLYEFFTFNSIIDLQWQEYITIIFWNLLKVSSTLIGGLEAASVPCGFKVDPHGSNWTKSDSTWVEPTTPMDSTWVQVQLSPNSIRQVTRNGITPPTPLQNFQVVFMASAVDSSLPQTAKSTAEFPVDWVYMGPKWYGPASCQRLSCFEYLYCYNCVWQITKCNISWQV